MRSPVPESNDRTFITRGGRRLTDRLSNDELARLIHEHGATVTRYVRRRSSASIADELVNEVFSTAWLKGPMLHVSNESAWLIGIAHRLMANRFRSDRRRISLRNRAQEAPVHRSTDDPQIELRGLQALDPKLLQAVMALNPGDLDILLLAAWEELDTAGIATVLSITPEVARKRLSRARQRVARLLSTPT